MRTMRKPGKLLPRLPRLSRTLARDETGISMVEFALCLPVIIGLGMGGMEIANMTSANMQVSQLALSVADNASRLGQTDNSAVAPTVAETDIDALMFGAMEQGSSLNFEDNGRIILSSLEKDPVTDKQYIHWQRCAGDLNERSDYGNDSDMNGLNGTEIPYGLGQTGRRVMAGDNQAVMFVEVFYRYTPLFPGVIVDEMQFKKEAAFIVRDDRNLTGGGGDGLSGTTTSTC
ncbi:hypothetical protein WYH_00472 [Croceibacterium atlanticum]|uniref:TadE-like domain-containing protein n=3 Tax=Croceibacterium atlanticum TaxID=1267766 RepID=A0A0F7KR06_9SPHN|nr:hypothetical protein WYH_00472 [Croceibacterium atlanticum]